MMTNAVCKTFSAFTARLVGERSPCAQVVFNISSESVHDQAAHPGVKVSALPLLLFGQLQMELQTEPTSSGCGVAEGAVASLLNRCSEIKRACRSSYQQFFIHLQIICEAVGKSNITSQLAALCLEVNSRARHSLFLMW